MAAKKASRKKCQNCGLTKGSHAIDCPTVVERLERQSRAARAKLAKFPPEIQKAIKDAFNLLCLAIADIGDVSLADLEKEVSQLGRRPRRAKPRGKP